MAKEKLSPVEPPGHVSLAEAARRLNVSGPTIRRWVEEGRLKGWFHPVSDRCRVLEKALREYERDVEQPPDDLIDLHEAARALSISINTMMRWIARGLVKAYSNPVTGQNKGISRSYLEGLLKQRNHRSR